MAHYRALGRLPRQRHTQLRDADGQPLPRGADGRGGLLLRLLAALPPRRAVGDRRQPGLGAARPVAARPTTRSSRATSSCTTSTTGDADPVDGPPAGARQQRRPHLLRRHRHRAVAATTATPSATSASTSSPAPAPSRRSSGCWPTAPATTCVIPRATDHRWVPAEPSPALRDRGQQPHRARRSATSRASASSSSTRRTASATCTARPSRSWSRAPTSRCWSSTAPAPGIVGTRMTYATHPFDVVGWDGCLYPYTFNIEDYMPITGKVHQPPPVHQVFEGWNFVICNFLPRKVDYHPLVDPGALLPLQRRLRRGHVLRRRRLRGAQGLGHRHRLDLACTRAATPTARSRARSRRPSGVEYFDESAVMVDTFAPLELGEGGLRGRGPGVRLDLGGPRTRRGRRRRRARRCSATADPASLRALGRCRRSRDRVVG